MRWKPALGTLLFLAATYVAGSEQLNPIWSIAVFLIGVGAAWLLMPGFWRSVFHGAIGGVVAGLLILGPGLRLAMRVVAILDPIRSPEFTFGGTMFIIVGIGAIFGGIFGAFGGLARRGFGIPLRGAGIVPALLVALMIGLDTELRSEIIELGVGPWLNVPMFAAVAVGYGALWALVITRLEAQGLRKKPRHEFAENATMTASNPLGLEI
ncbi:MAG: hypothetical protein ACFCU2_13225 [Acidimicrobiia bacterium]